MKNSIVNRTLALALPLVLVACGGGGGDNPAADSTPTPNQSQNNGTDKYGFTATERQNIATISQDMQPKFGVERLEGYVIAARQSDLANGTSLFRFVKRSSGSVNYPAQVDTGTSLQTVFIPGYSDTSYVDNRGKRPEKIGGVNIYTNYYLFSSGASSYKNFDYFLASDADKYRSIQFGIAKTSDSDPMLLAYYRGKTTPEASLPKTGIVNYQGDFITMPGTLPQGTSPIGKVAANVDFASKGAAFAFATDNGYRGNISAEIIGSLLVGRDGTKSVDGIFSGSIGEELTGSYQDGTAGIVGVYGAVRQ